MTKGNSFIHYPVLKQALLIIIVLKRGTSSFITTYQPQARPVLGSATPYHTSLLPVPREQVFGCQGTDRLRSRERGREYISSALFLLALGWRVVIRKYLARAW